MKFFIIIILIIPVCLYSQQTNWEYAGIPKAESNHFIFLHNDTVNDVLYSGGYLFLNNNGNKGYILRYKNNICDTLPNLFDGVVRTIIQYRGEIYAGGNFQNVDTIETGGIVKWDGLNWSRIGNGLFDSIYNTWGSIWKLRVYNDTLYAVGTFNSFGEIYGFAKWNGLEWENVHNLPQLRSMGNDFKDVGFYDDKIILGGQVTNDTIKNLILFDGNDWIKPDISSGGTWGQINVITIYKNELYIGGNINDSLHIAKYNGISWSNVGTGLSDGGGTVNDFRVYNDELFVVGSFLKAGSVPAKYLAKWDGAKWCALGGDFNIPVACIEFFHDTLYASCDLSVDNIYMNGIVRWIGGNYVDTCSTVGVNEVFSEKGILQIYPNPSQITLTIDLNIPGLQTAKTETTYRIIDKLGRTIKTGLINSFPYTVLVDELREGMYIIIIQNDGIIEKRKFVKLTQ